MVDPFSAVSRFLLEGAPRQDSSQARENPNWTPGTRVVAEVRAIIDPTRAVLQIGEHVVDARLPVPVKLGERVPLRVAEPFPKLVFVLEAEDGSLAHRTKVSISSAARVIAEVIRTTEPGQAGKPLRLTEPLPLPQGAAPQPEEVARSLKQAVERSGLFYERHQARWSAGAYPLAELAREPQARLHRQAVTSSQSSPAALREPALPGENLEALPVGEKPGAAKEVSITHAPFEAPLRAQLDLLDGRPVMVAIPGWEPQDIHWELPQREQGREEQEGEEIWTTQLHLSFTRLGQVTAQIRLVNDKLALVLATESGETQGELVTRQEALMEAFKAAGLNLSGLAVTERNG